MQRYHFDYTTWPEHDDTVALVGRCSIVDCTAEHVYVITKAEYDAIWRHDPEYYRTNFGNPPD